MNDQIIDEAAEWFVEFSGGDATPEAKRAFDAWLRKSPEHVRVYLEMVPIWNDAAIALPGDLTSAEDLIALAGVAENVVVLPANPMVRRHRYGLPRKRWLAAAVSAAVLMVGVCIVWLQWYRALTYVTAVGEHRSLTLPDGSSVELNTHSRLRVDFTARARRVELIEGQALFRVARDPLRPFMVESGVTRIRAVGTQFDVYRKTGGTTVTVLEGKVAVGSLIIPQEDTASPPAVVASSAEAVTRAANSGTPVLLSAGQQITVSPTLSAAARQADVRAAAAWTQGRLIFNATPLPEVAAEFNRYSNRTISVDDATLADFQVNGSFRSTDPGSLIRFLHQQPELAVNETPALIHIARRQSRQ
jgi:transmembrane sensor